jgi:hypothetical protein
LVLAVAVGAEDEAWGSAFPPGRMTDEIDGVPMRAMAGLRRDDGLAITVWSSRLHVEPWFKPSLIAGQYDNGLAETGFFELVADPLDRYARAFCQIEMRDATVDQLPDKPVINPHGINVQRSNLKPLELTCLGGSFVWQTRRRN